MMVKIAILSHGHIHNTKVILSRCLALSGYSVQAPSASKLLRFRKPLPGCLFTTEP